jgi:two-component system response regulator AtoC
MNNPHALIVEDEAAARTALVEIVRRQGFSVAAAPTLAEAKRLMQETPPDVLLADLVLPDGSGLDLAADLDRSRRVDVILITGKATVESVIQALRQGVSDYLTKPVDVGRLKAFLADIVRSRAEEGGRQSSLAEAAQRGMFGHLHGRSPAMLAMFRHIQKVAPTDATVLLVGETGTGKELVARTIHDQSDRSPEPFMPLNCGTVTQTLIESELFGHEQGSFTGASRKHTGVFERAGTGTLFLDEITEMSVDLQVKLLRVLETGQFHRIGGERMVDTGARVIAATNRSPEEAVRQGRLREDLFYRLRVFPILLPPLRERVGDVELLAQHFLDQLNQTAAHKKTVTPGALRRLAAHSWPGNVRELKNLIHRAFILADGELDEDSLELLQAPAAGGDMVSIPVGTTIAEAERRLILATMERLEGNKSRVATVLGISLKTLYARLNVYAAHGPSHDGRGAANEDRRAPSTP